MRGKKAGGEEKGKKHHQVFAAANCSQLHPLLSKMQALHHANASCLVGNACITAYKCILPCKNACITACKCTCPAKCMHCITQTHPPLQKMHALQHANAPVLQNACTASYRCILPCKNASLQHANAPDLQKCMHCITQTHPPLQKCMHCIMQTHPALHKMHA